MNDGTKVVVLALVCFLLITPTTAQAQDSVDLVGAVSNGTAEADFEPASVQVTLNILEGVVSLDQRSTNPDTTGRFVFPNVPVGAGRVYFVSAEHQGAIYSDSLDSSDLPFGSAVTVFDATASTDVLAFESYSVIITGADRNKRIMEVLERASVRNDSDYALVPSLADEGSMMLSFLRFALPAGATNLDVRATLVGGDILEVDRGFAINTPVPPTPGDSHSFEFIYRLPYQGDSADLSRTMRFGADSFRYVIPVNTGFGSSTSLNNLGSTALSGRELQLMKPKTCRGTTC